MSFDPPSDKTINQAAHDLVALVHRTALGAQVKHVESFLKEITTPRAAIKTAPVLGEITKEARFMCIATVAYEGYPAAAMVPSDTGEWVSFATVLSLRNALEEAARLVEINSREANEARLELASITKERNIYAELAANQCVIQKVTDELGQQTLCSSKEFSRLKKIESDMKVVRFALSRRDDPSAISRSLCVIDEALS